MRYWLKLDAGKPALYDSLGEIYLLLSESLDRFCTVENELRTQCWTGTEGRVKGEIVWVLLGVKKPGSEQSGEKELMAITGNDREARFTTTGGIQICKRGDPPWNCSKFYRSSG
jgi:hypothetical protein